MLHFSGDHFETPPRCCWLTDVAAHAVRKPRAALSVCLWSSVCSPPSCFHRSDHQLLRDGGVLPDHVISAASCFLNHILKHLKPLKMKVFPSVSLSVGEDPSWCRQAGGTKPVSVPAHLPVTSALTPQDQVLCTLLFLSSSLSIFPPSGPPPFIWSKCQLLFASLYWGLPFLPHPFLLLLLLFFSQYNWHRLPAEYAKTAGTMAEEGRKGGAMK